MEYTHGMWRAAAILVLITTGCQTWKEPAGQSLSLPAPRVPADAAVLEVAFVEISGDDRERFQALWQVIDETVVPADARDRFVSNGLRWGVVPATVPPPIQEVIAHSLAEHDEGGRLGRELGLPGTSSGPSARRLQLRPGRHATVVTDRPAAESTVLLWTENGKILGRELPAAECQFDVQVAPAAAGDVTVTLTPRVEYGEPKSRVVGHEGTWVMQTEREQLVLDELTIQVRLSPGQLLAVGSGMPARAVGATFFAGQVEEGQPQRLLLIRLAGSSSHDLFVTAQPSGE